MKQILAFILNSFFGIIDRILTFCIVHSKICVLLFIGWLIATCWLSKKAEKTEIFGFWWKLNRRLDTLLNVSLKILLYIFAIEIIGCFMIYLYLYKGV